MQKHWDNFLFGLFFGIGLIAAYGVVRLILWLLSMIFSGAHPISLT